MAGPSEGTIWQRVKRIPRLRSALGYEETLWTRKVADEEVRRLIAPLRPETLSALEISGQVWAEYGFGQYRSTDYPEFDVCEQTLPERFDLVIAEHVFEHLAWPARAARNVLAMLRPGGHFLMVTPFLFKVHHNPIDGTRWTETGLRHFLAEAGFPLDGIVTGSWGNRDCIRATFTREYRLFNRYLHSLENEPEYPVVCWALARAPE